MITKQLGFPHSPALNQRLKQLLWGFAFPLIFLLLFLPVGLDSPYQKVFHTADNSSVLPLSPVFLDEVAETALASPLHTGSFPYTFEFSNSVMPGGGTNSYTQADGTNVNFQFSWDSNPPGLSTTHDTGGYSGLSSANFWITSGLGTSAYTMTLSFSGADDVVALGFDIVHINVSIGGDKVTIAALTESGATLTPTYTQPSNPDYTLSGNVADAIAFDSAPEYNLGVNISASSADPIASVSLTWEECGICTSDMHGVGVSDIDFSIVSSDWDGDGVIDKEDLDDDNDGILDEVESCGSVGGGTGTVVVEILTDDWAEETSWTLKDASNTTVLSDSYTSSDDNTTFSYTLNNASGDYTFQIDDSANDGICCGYGMGHYEIKLDGTTIVGGSGSGVGAFGTSATENFTVGGSFACLSGDPSGDADGDGTLNYEDADFCTLNGNGVCSSLDTDGDGIIDQFDNDADADGCPDAMEGAGSYFETDMDVNDQLTAAVDGDGIPGGTTQGVGDAQDSGANTLCQDKDGDGVTNRNDLDDDNDGILDEDEQCGLGPELVTNGDFEDAYAHWTSDFNRGRNNYAATAGGCPAMGWVAVSPCASTNGGCDTYYDYNGSTPDGSTLITDAYGTGANVLPTTTCNSTANQCLAESLPDHTTGTGFSVYIDPNDIPGESYWIQTVTVSANTWYTFSAWIMVIEEDPNLEFKIDGSSLTGGINLDRLTGGSDGPDQWQQVTTDWYSGPTNGSVVLELSNLTAGCGGNDIRIDDISLRAYVDCDTDSDGIADHFDNDSDADGCPDALEGAGSYTYSDIDVDNRLTATVDGNGQPGGASQATGDAQDENTQSNECTGCASGSTLFTDADGDGLGDKCDLDDDNDAIGDWEEGRAEQWNVSGGWNSNSGTVGDHDGFQNSTYVASVNNPLTVGVGLSFNLGGGDDFSEDTGYSTGSSMAIYGVDQSSMAAAISNNDYLEMQFTTAASWTGDVELAAMTYAQYMLQGTSTIIGGQFSYGLQVSDDNFATSTILRRSTLLGAAGSDSDYSTVTFNGADYTNYKAEFSSYYTLTPGTSYQVRMYLFADENGDNKINLDDLYLNVYHSQDLDDNGTANYLDLDTDGDGCADGIEGSGAFTAADLDGSDRLDYANITPSGVDANGVPSASYGGQGVGDSQNASTQDPDCAGGAGAPIELLGFSLFSHKDGYVKILWETLTETHNDFFTIERSIDAENWEILTQVAGAGNSSEPLKYQAVDAKPLPGTSYYRLKQTDFDGDYTYSQIIDLYLKPNRNMPLEVFPNPTSGPITLSGAPEEISSYTLYDIQGQNVMYQVEIVEQDYYQVFLDLSDLPRGVYLLQTASQTLKVRKE